MATSYKISAAVFVAGCLLSLLCSSSSATRDIGTFTNTSAATLGDVFNTAVLYLYWPGTFCTSMATCCPPTTGYVQEDSFLVWGLVYYSSSTGKYCYNGPQCGSFDLNGLEDLVPSLNVYWPDLNCPANDGTKLWKQLWCAYGSCGTLNQEQYFTNAIVTGVQNEPYKVLKAANITAGKSYSLESIKTALRQKLAFAYNIECHPQKTDTLYRINICLNSVDGKTPVPCRGQFLKTNCQSTVKFPAGYKVNGVTAAEDEVIKMPTDL